jgi:Domain of unknown function (DUF4349)/Putative zinc-finger
MNKVIHPIEPEELMAYLDGELAPDRTSAAAAHLNECAECQSLVAEMQSVSQNLQSWKIEPPESAMPSAIATALAEKQPESRNAVFVPRRTWREFLRQRWPVLAWAGTAAAVVLLVLSAVTLPDLRREGSSAQLSTPREAVQLIAPESAMLDKKITAGSVGVKPDQEKYRTRSLSTRDFSTSDQDHLEASEPPASTVPPVHGPMIIRTAQLSLITKEFDKARTNLEAILKQHRGFVGELKVGGNAGSGRTLTATLRVPADQLDGMLADTKKLGRVDSETQGGQDTTSEYVDLQARLSNAHNTAQRLTEILRNRTGKLADVLAVEQELDRVRGEIEEMEAERKTMLNQVSYATLTATITEDYQAQLQAVPPSTSTRLGNAAVEGYRNMVEGILSLALFLLSNGPSLLLWAAILFMPARTIWKRVRRSFAS